MDARSTSPSSKIYSQVLITVQTRLKPSTPLDRFQQAWLFRSCMLSGKHSYRDCGAELATAGWLRAAGGQNLHLLQDRCRLTCHLAQQFPVRQSPQRSPKPVTLYSYTGTLTPSLVCVTWDNSASYIAFGLFCPRNRIWKWVEILKKLRFLGKLLSLL